MARRLLFAGTPAAAVPALRACAAAHTVVRVLTRPARPAGRGHRARPSPVAEAAAALGIPVETPERLRDAGALAAATAGAPELGVVVAYGQILPRAWLDALPLGWVNLHFSLLPRWRGAAPVAAAIRAGDAETGVTVMRVVRRLDAGPVVASLRTPIGRDETTGTLEARLAELGAPLLVRVVADLDAGRAVETPQDEATASVAPMLAKADGRVDFGAAPDVLARHVRAMTPWPGAQATFLPVGRAPVPVLLRTVVPVSGAATDVDAGVVYGPSHGLVATGAGAARIVRLQPSGKREMEWEAFRNGYRVAAGDRFA